MKTTEATPYCFPRIANVQLFSFDLYQRRPEVNVKTDNPVLCLMGANGIGKSSFLNTLIYGLTGGIPFRERAFSSPREYTDEALRIDRRQDYYGGRLSPSTIPHAAIRVDLSWPTTRASVTRQLFGPGAVIGLEIETDGDGVPSASDHTDTESDYRALVVAQCGLPDFDQFIFLMHYVCTFDEERHLLLWDPIALTNALYLAFGTDGSQAANASRLKRAVERFGSRARNSRFAARQSLDEANRLRSALEGDNNGEDTDAVEERQYMQLNERLDDAVQRIHRKDMEVRKAEAMVSDLSAALTELQIEYENKFSARAAGSTATKHHPLIRATIRNDRCAVCASTGVAERVANAVDDGICPLCGTTVLGDVDDAEVLGELRVLDQGIEQVRDRLRAHLDQRARLRDDYETALQAEMTAREARDAFLNDHPNADRYSRSATDPTAINTAIERRESEARRFDAQSKREYRERDRARRNLLKLERNLQHRFEESSKRFTDLFRTYAEEFIGLTVDIELEHRRGVNETGFELLLTLEDQVRTRAEAVSESQRFFLDIALRMALAEFMSSPTATLLIDTPEGSLDITYEARAGEMFSNFAKRGNAILMTANLRTSALLRRLAERQQRSGMTIERMTDWTDLSDVQRQEEQLFVGVYADIEKALR